MYSTDFLVRNLILVSNERHHMWPNSIVKECSSLCCRDVATASKTVTLVDKCNQEALLSGSNGSSVSLDSVTQVYEMEGGKQTCP